MSEPCQVEMIFREVAAMRQQMPRNHGDPYKSEEYQRFVESMIEYCHCAERHRPCDGVLAGGLCDGIKDEPEDYEDREDDDLDQ